jgi:pimeloyl-ACP methyl ester carboxylesterase
MRAPSAALLASWLDHARDVLLLTNHFRASMPRPLIGMGHSFGGAIMAEVALIHPRLFSSLVLLDPVATSLVRTGQQFGFSPMRQSAYRRDKWPSRAAAAASFRRNAFYRTWDPRVLDRWIEHGLRPTPTAIYPSPSRSRFRSPSAPASEGEGEGEGEVTLTTTKHMECFTYFRPQAQTIDPATGQRIIDRGAIPDADPAMLDADSNFLFYRPEGAAIARRLPALRPGVLWIFGDTSNVNPPVVRQEKLHLTGTGIGGSGGAKAGRVRAITIPEYGHLVPLEATARCAEHGADFIAKDLEHWRADEAEFQAWAAKPAKEKQQLDDNWRRWMGPLDAKPKL